jgi:hypothetical protein
METLWLLRGLSEDLAAGTVTQPFDTYEQRGYGGRLTYYAALQGEGASQKLYVLLWVGGDREMPPVLWTYGRQN